MSFFNRWFGSSAKDKLEQGEAQSANVRHDFTEVINSLIRLLNDRIPFVRIAAADSLGQIASVKAVEPLIALIRSKNEDMDAAKSAAVNALGKINSANAIEFLVSLDADKNLPHMTRYSVTEVLKNRKQSDELKGNKPDISQETQIPKDAVGNLDRLQEILLDGTQSYKMRREAAEALSV